MKSGFSNSSWILKEVEVKSMTVQLRILSCSGSESLPGRTRSLSTSLFIIEKTRGTNKGWLKLIAAMPLLFIEEKVTFTGTGLAAVTAFLVVG